MKHELMKVVIQKRTLRVELMKNGMRSVSLNVINDVRAGCFKAVSIAIRRALMFFERKNKNQFEKNHIERISSQLSTDGLKFAIESMERN